jgi:L-histidine N-alpha-methyltransferase
MKSSSAVRVSTSEDRVNIHKPREGTADTNLAEDVHAGLTAAPKMLPPKYFYDEIGSDLFEQICATPEYYPTRIEHGLLEDVVNEVVELSGPEVIIELGSGSSRKTELLLQAVLSVQPSLHYIPIDVSEKALVDAGERLVQRFPPLTVDALLADYERGLKHERVREQQANKLFVFLGGTIGNFDHHRAVELISTVRRQMGDDDRFLIGADRVKNHETLHRAYNDKRGITAQFNLNVLRVINRELEAAFDLETFEHHAFYDPDLSRIEMHLISKVAQKVPIRILDLTVEFGRRESILTEISRKFTLQGLTQLFAEADMVIERHYEPENRYFSLVFARPA